MTPSRPIAGHVTQRLHTAVWKKMTSIGLISRPRLQIYRGG